MAEFKQHVESFFIAGAARIDLIAETMDLDNDIGGYNFDIPLLDETETAIKDATKTKGKTLQFVALNSNNNNNNNNNNDNNNNNNDNNNNNEAKSSYDYTPAKQFFALVNNSFPGNVCLKSWNIIFISFY